jgi:hypothetical protein
MRTGYKSLCVNDYSQAILTSFLDKSQYMEEDIKNVYTHDDAMLKVDPILRHIYPDHVYNIVSHRIRVLHELQRLLAGIGHRKALTCCVQVSSGVDLLPASCWRELPPGTNFG